MSAISNLRIGSRLGLAFAIVLLLTLVLGVTAVFKIAQVNDATADLATNWLPATRALGEYENGLNAVRRAEAQHLLALKPEDMTSEENRIQAAKAQADKAWKVYDPTITPGEERQIADEIRKAEAQYYDVLGKLMEISRGGEARKAEALTYFKTATRPAYNALLDAVNKDIAFQTKGGDGAYALSQSAYANTRWLVIGLVVSALVLGAVVAWGVTRSITVPIGVAVQMAETVAAGDLTSRIPINSRDETGQLLAALQRMNDNLAQIVGEVRTASDSIATGTSQIATGNADLSQRTEMQASNLQQTAASMEQMTAAVQRNTEAAQQANQLSASTADAATQGGQVVGQVVTTMTQISDSSRKIADIIGVIDGIAFQTNILALNAAVEAARAGEQGRGFAVVAGEVRTLASRSAEAAKEIKALIQHSVDRVEAGGTLVAQAGDSIQNVMSQVRRVNDLVAEISAASMEQNSGIGQIGDAVMQLDQVTQQNAALVEESAAAAESLRHQAARLSEVVARFRLSGDTQRAEYVAPVVAAAPQKVAARAPTPAHARPLAHKPAPSATKVAVAPRAPALAKAAPVTAPTAHDDSWDTF